MFHLSQGFHQQIISQGSVATRLTFAEIFNDQFPTNLPQSLMLKCMQF